MQIEPKYFGSGFKPKPAQNRIRKDIYSEAIYLFTSFVKAKPKNGDLLMALATLPEGAKKKL